MKFEITKKVRTPDGVEHDSVEAAHAHMKASAFGILGNATSADFEACVKEPEKMIGLRTAIRDIYLAAWPRASKGVPRGPRKAKEPAAEGETQSATAEAEPASEPPQRGVDAAEEETAPVPLASRRRR